MDDLDRELRPHHVGIMTADLYPMMLFYRSQLGFQELYRYVSSNTPGLRTVFLERNGLQLELLHYENHLVEPGHRVHIHLTVDDLDREYRILTDEGVPVVSHPRMTGDGFYEMAVRDPEGNILEIAQKGRIRMADPIKAIIFDLDGTLIDSEPNYYLADKEFLSRYGIDFPEESKKEFVGRGNREMIRIMKERYNIQDDAETILKLKNDIYLEIARKNTTVYPAMKEFLLMAFERGYPLAVASGSSPVILDEILDITGLKPYFAHIVSAEDVANGKPQPDIFLETARRMAIKPENCCVVEDSQYGVEAAKRAFMSVIAVPYLIDKPLQDPFYLSDLLFENGMTEFSAIDAVRWIESRHH